MLTELNPEKCFFSSTVLSLGARFVPLCWEQNKGLQQIITGVRVVHIWAWNKIILHDSSTNLIIYFKKCRDLWFLCTCWHQLCKQCRRAPLMETHVMHGVCMALIIHTLCAQSYRTWKTQTHNKQPARWNTKRCHHHRWSKWDADRKWRARFVYLQRGPRVGRHPAIVFPWDDPTGQWWPCHGPHTWEQKHTHWQTMAYESSSCACSFTLTKIWDFSQLGFYPLTTVKKIMLSWKEMKNIMSCWLRKRSGNKKPGCWSTYSRTIRVYNVVILICL